MENKWNRVARIDLGSPSCLSLFTVALTVGAFLTCQTILLVSWACVCRQRRHNSLLENEMLYGGSNSWSGRSGGVPPPLPAAVSHKSYAYPESGLHYSAPSRHSASYIYS